MSEITIFHNANCSNSRDVLALLQAQGITPHIVDYIATPLTTPELAELVAHIGVPARELLRTKESLYRELQLDGPEITDTHILVAMATHPVLLNRPIVVTPKGAALCRPPEKVLDLLP